MGTPNSAVAFAQSGMNVANQTIQAGEDISANVMRMSDSGTVTRITAATTTLVSTGRGVLKRVFVEVALTGTATIYDNTAGSGTVLTILPIGTPAGVYPLGFDFTTGCTVVTSAADRLVTVTNR